MTENKIEITRPFGPSITKFKMPNKMVEVLNDYIEKIILDKKKSKDLDFGENLAGNVQQEFRLEDEFSVSSGLAKLLADTCSAWLFSTDQKKITLFNIISCWIVRQFANEYNPIHHHNGHISGVGYLKVPKNLGKTIQPSKKDNPNGALVLIHGNKMFNSNATLSITPEVGDFYMFPNYMMHTVYPFSNSDEERRSISFNATIDEKIYNVYDK
jgi:hypothetical protein